MPGSESEKDLAAAAVVLLTRRGRGTARSGVEGGLPGLTLLTLCPYVRPESYSPSRPVASPPDDATRGPSLGCPAPQNLGGFRRQHPIGPYGLDFYCAAAKLCVEVDGQTHWLGDAQARDLERDAWLALRGVRTLRLSASLVFEDLDTALRMIEATA